MEAAHTPGPWLLDERTTAPRVVVNVSPRRIEDVARPQVIGSRPDRHAVRLANARLIAAAPDLLEALKIIAVNTDPENPDSYRCDDREGCLGAVLFTAREAIAKATGQ